MIRKVWVRMSVGKHTTQFKLYQLSSHLKKLHDPWTEINLSHISALIGFYIK